MYVKNTYLFIYNKNYKKNLIFWLGDMSLEESMTTGWWKCVTDKQVAWRFDKKLLLQSLLHTFCSVLIVSGVWNLQKFGAPNTYLLVNTSITLGLIRLFINLYMEIVRLHIFFIFYIVIGWIDISRYKKCNLILSIEFFKYYNYIFLILSLIKN